MEMHLMQSKSLNTNHKKNFKQGEGGMIRRWGRPIDAPILDPLLTYTVPI